jgi:hypothetical protein
MTIAIAVGAGLLAVAIIGYLGYYLINI